MFYAACKYQPFAFWFLMAGLLVFGPMATADTPLSEPIPEDTVVEIECSWNQKGVGLDPAATGTYYYSVYLPVGYYEKANANRNYPCLVVTSQRGRLNAYQRWLKDNEWIGISLKERMYTPRFEDVPKDRPREAKGNFQAAMTDAVKRLRLNRGVGILETGEYGAYLPSILLPLANGYLRGVLMVEDTSGMSSMSREKLFVAAIGPTSNLGLLKPSELQNYPKGYADGWLWPADSRGQPRAYLELGLDWLKDHLMAAPGIRRDPMMVGQYLLKLKAQADRSGNVLEQYFLLLQIQRTLKANTKALNAPGIEECIKSADEQIKALKKESQLARELKAWEAYQDFYRNVTMHLEKISGMDRVQTLDRTEEAPSTKRKKEQLREELLKSCVAFVRKYSDTQAALKVRKMGEAFNQQKPSAGQWDIPWPPLTLDQLKNPPKTPATQPAK